MRVLGEIVPDKPGGLLLRESCALRKAEVAHPVDDAKIDGLGQATHFRRHLRQANAQDRGRSAGVDILIAPEGCLQLRIARDVGQDAQFDLRIVRFQEPASWWGDEGLPHLSSHFRPDGDILQVRVAGGEPACDRSRLIIRGVQATGAAVHQGGQRIQIGGLDLGQLAILGQMIHDGVRAAKLLHDAGIGGKAGLRPLWRGQPQLDKEHLGQLLSRVQVERVAGGLVNPFLQIAHALRQFLGHALQKGHVQSHAMALHLDEHRDQGQFHLLVQPHQLLLRQFFAQRLHQAQGHVHIRPRVGCDAGDGHLGHGDLSFADEGGNGRHLHAEPLPGQLLQTQVRPARIQEKSGDHRVKG